VKRLDRHVRESRGAVMNTRIPTPFITARRDINKKTRRGLRGFFT
jgi:hypothetical protein